MIIAGVKVFYLYRVEIFQKLAVRKTHRVGRALGIQRHGVDAFMVEVPTQHLLRRKVFSSGGCYLKSP